MFLQEKQMFMWHRKLALAAAVVLAGVTILSPLGAQQAAAQDDAADTENGTIRLQLGRSTVIEAPWAVSSVSVAEPAIADVQIVTPQQVVVLGKTVGNTDVMLWNEDGRSLRREVRVEADVVGIQGDLDDLFPSATLKVRQSQNIVAVTGTLRRAEDAARLHALMDAAGVKFVDMTSVAGVQQVLIQVRVAEASRLALRSLGVDAFYTGNEFFGGSTLGGLTSFDLDTGSLGSVAAIDTTVNNAVTVFAGIPDADLQFFLQALAENQYLRILAEPSLVALSGEEASFLAGGEFPIPVVQGSTGAVGAGTSITIEFKEFGVRLRFRPTVLGDGTIRLKVAPEVSALSDVGSVQIEGFNIPSLTTRRAETTLEMKTGQTFALAGLIDQETRARSGKVPGLGSIPVIGSLFRSVRYQQEDTELVVLATVHLVEPLSVVSDRPLPGDLHEAPSDWELYAAGQIESRTPARISPAHAKWLEDNRLDKLSGPGAWAPYMDEPKRPGAANEAAEAAAEKAAE